MSSQSLGAFHKKIIAHVQEINETESKQIREAGKKRTKKSLALNKRIQAV